MHALGWVGNTVFCILIVLCIASLFAVILLQKAFNKFHLPDLYFTTGLYAVQGQQLGRTYLYRQNYALSKLVEWALVAPSEPDNKTSNSVKQRWAEEQ